MGSSTSHEWKPGALTPIPYSVTDKRQPKAYDTNNPGFWWFGPGPFKWPAIDAVFDFTNTKVSFECGATAVDESKTAVDGKTGFLANVVCPLLMRKTMQNGVAVDQSVTRTTQNVKDDLTGLVQKFWTWTPPGGAYVSNVDGNPAIIGGVLDGLPRIANWTAFTTIMKIADGGSNWTEWDTLKGKGESDYSLTNSAISVPGVGSVNGIQFVPFYKSDTLQLLKNANINNSRLNISDFPLSYSITIQAYLSTDAGKMVDLTGPMMDLYGIPKAGADMQWDQPSKTVTFKVTNYQCSGVDQMAKVLVLLCTDGLKFPINFSTLGDINASKVRFCFNVKMVMMNGAYVFNGGEDGGLMLDYAFRLVNPATASLGQNSTVYMLDWTSGVDSSASACVDGCSTGLGTDEYKKCVSACRSTVCSGGQIATQYAAGTCGREINNTFGKIETQLDGLIQNFVNSTSIALSSSGSTIRSIQGFISNLRATPFYSLDILRDTRTTIEKFSSDLQSLSNRVNLIRETIQSQLQIDLNDYGTTPNSAQICNLSDSVDKALAIQATVNSTYDGIRSVFTGIVTLVDDKKGSLNALLTSDPSKFNLDALLNGVRTNLTELARNMANQQSAGADATGGVSNNPNGLTVPITTTSADPVQPPASKSKTALPMPAIIGIVAGVVCLVGVGFAVYRYNQRPEK